MSALDVILVSKTRADIFRLLFGLSSKPRYLREIERLSGVTVRILQQELKSLAAAGLVVCRKDGNRTYYEPNKSHPLYGDLRNIVLKTAGLSDVLREALQSDGIQWAFVFGSMARDEAGAESDIDLMVIGSLGLRKLSGLLSGVSEKIGREINPHVFLIEEFRKKVQEEDHFVSSVLDSPLLFVAGDENEFRAMVQ
jgi:predicted nucleotidyltransferase